MSTVGEYVGANQIVGGGGGDNTIFPDWANGRFCTTAGIFTHAAIYTTDMATRANIATAVGDVVCAPSPFTGITPVPGAIAADGNLYLQPGDIGHNSDPIFRVDPLTLTQTAQFGSPGSLFSLPLATCPLRMRSCVAVHASVNYIVAQQLGSGFLGPGILFAVNVNAMADSGFASASIPVVMMAAGNPGSSSFVVMIDAGNGAGSNASLTVRQLNISGAPTFILNTIGTVAATDIDPAWTSGFNAQDVGCDLADDNMIVNFFTATSAPTQQYLAKIRMTDASVMWVIPMPGFSGNLSGGLSKSRINGSLHYFSTGGGMPTGSTLFTINTLTGAFTTTVVPGYVFDSSNLGGQIFDSTTGRLILISSYDSTVMGSPTPEPGTPSTFSIAWSIFSPPAPPPPPPVVLTQFGGGELCGWRGLTGINWNGLALVGDKFSGVVGLSDFSIFNEYGNQMHMLVTTPPLHDDRKRIFIPRFEIEVEAGQGNDDGSAPQMMLDYSKDGGKTFVGLQMFRSMGAVGEYVKRLRWINLGQSRTWIFRLQYAGQARPVIIGSYWSGYRGLG